MNKHVEYLTQLRDHLRSERRKLVERWATLKSMPSSLTKLIRIQTELHAVEVAIRDEQATERPPTQKEVRPVEQKYPPDDIAADARVLLRGAFSVNPK